MLPPERMSPEWFRDRLHARLVAQRAEHEFFDAYYTGDHPLPFVRPEAREEFRRVIQMTRTNVMGLVCDATAERISLEGFQLDGGESVDAESWRIWQANGLVDDSDLGWLEALIGGRSFFSAEHNRDDQYTPLLHVEHATQCAIEYVPGTGRRVRKAGLKEWNDDWTGEVHCTVYLVEDNRLWLYKYCAKQTRVGSRLRWERREVPGEEWPADGRLDVLPIVEVPNNPRLLPGGISELYDVTDIQDRINKTLLDRMETQEFGVDPQKYGIAFPATDEDGNPNTVEFGRNRMVTTDVAESRFGNFAVAPLAPLLEAKREDTKDIASRTRTPAQYLLGEMSNVNGETLKASESGLVSKVRQRRKPYGQSAGEIMRVAHALAGRTIPPGVISSVFNDPQYRTEGERTDAAIKRYQTGLVPLYQTLVDLGYSQSQITAMEAARSNEALDPVAAALVDSVNRDAAAPGDGS